MTTWLAVAGVGLGSYALRLLPLLLSDRIRWPIRWTGRSATPAWRRSQSSSSPESSTTTEAAGPERRYGRSPR